jgi:hypothetical protein
MPDWRATARKRLGPLALEAKRQEEIVLELAGHLEDLYSDALRQGRSHTEALQSAFSAASDWDTLRREIEFAVNEEGSMNYRVKTLWLPGACTIALSGMVLRLLQIPSAPVPRVLWPWHSSELVIYWWWLLSLPVIGAIGAYWSRHAGGRFLERALAVSLPALGMVCLPLLMFPFVLVYDLIHFHSFPFVPMAILLFGWGVLPEAALLAGGLPFFRRAGSTQPGRAVPSH